MEFNLKEKQLLQEIVKKYKQGIISGSYPGTNITFTPSGCRDKVISSLNSGGSTRTISFVSRFKDMDNNIHFVTLTANIPLLNNMDCVNGQSVTFTVDDF